ncbi:MULTISPECIES: conjugal transfer protein TraH [Vibrio]|uniref:Conjugal transfer protein TraH n=1 Tax=Vibrio splendidus TaxID=29497 RepID=A0A0H3ZXL0_VIBSP|nr:MULTISPECIES: conjugal transfer protein TraH [Vibrio]AKN37263.1 IncF plasmid conjugative transfer pilus assemblyprotein TraH [Vibrio splendidus]AKN38599.1 IncF plasmid conjugative transfer pilus assemblyprotein TraH [Vibrio splendidus]NOI88773.1 conjugal transfer protein TraH [Vibrio sp. 99K-1]OEE65411.1 conjugal transfer protein TraH [Vibrio splendidus FF-6]OEF76818.1 conjugal transfer protein TraH [Vibrio cyclitrophicus 1F111]
MIRPHHTPPGRARLIALMLSGLLTGASYAGGVNSSLDGFFNGLGYNANVTHPNAFKGQAANYYNGGSLYARTPIKSAQLMSVHLPEVSMGCGGIDAFMGGFSHINADGLVQFGKAVVQNAAPFAVDLALQVWAPQIKQIRDNLQNIADKFLNQSINSCEAAQAGVSGLAATFGGPAAKKHVCATIGTKGNVFDDWVGAQVECGVGGQSNAQVARARADGSAGLEDIAKTSHNIVWSAALKNGWLAGDKALAEFLMSLSGTYIYDANGRPKYYASLLADNNNLVDAMLKGGKIEYYKCDNTDEKACLSPQKKELTLAQDKGLEVRIRQTLEALYISIANDTGLTDNQKSFLEYTDTPVLAVFIGSVRSNRYPNFSAYARVISVELLTRYLRNMLTVVTTSLNHTQVDSKDIALIMSDIDRARDFTNGLSDKAKRVILTQEQLTQAYKESDSEAMSKINKQLLQNLSFGG